MLDLLLRQLHPIKLVWAIVKLAISAPLLGVYWHHAVRHKSGIVLIVYILAIMLYSVGEVIINVIACIWYPPQPPRFHLNLMAIPTVLAVYGLIAVILTRDIRDHFWGLYVWGCIFVAIGMILLMLAIICACLLILWRILDKREFEARARALGHFNKEQIALDACQQTRQWYQHHYPQILLHWDDFQSLTIPCHYTRCPICHESFPNSDHSQSCDDDGYNQLLMLTQVEQHNPNNDTKISASACSPSVSSQHDLSDNNTSPAHIELENPLHLSDEIAICVDEPPETGLAETPIGVENSSNHSNTTSNLRNHQSNTTDTSSNRLTPEATLDTLPPYTMSVFPNTPISAAIVDKNNYFAPVLPWSTTLNFLTKYSPWDKFQFTAYLAKQWQNQYIVLSCQHIFHAPCLLGAIPLELSPKFGCPVCSKPIFVECHIQQQDTDSFIVAPVLPYTILFTQIEDYARLGLPLPLQPPDEQPCIPSGPFDIQHAGIFH